MTDSLSVLSVLIGVLIIVSRGPLIFAPAATLRVFRNLVATDTRVRVIGVSIAPIGVALIVLPLGEGSLAYIFFSVGLIWTAAALWLILAPKSYRWLTIEVVDFFESSVDDAITRIFGALAVLLGVWLVYLGRNILC